MSRRHRVKTYLKHLRKAKGRHGVHSPFVYEFVDAFRNYPDTCPLRLITSHHRKLINRLIDFFNCRQIVWLTNTHGAEETYITINNENNDEGWQLTTERFRFEDYTRKPQPDLLLIDIADPADWLHAYNKYRHHLKPESMVLINAIHHSKQHTAAWKEICQLETVKLSLDLFKAGLLFFGKAFLEKQHFMLNLR